MISRFDARRLGALCGALGGALVLAACAPRATGGVDSAAADTAGAAPAARDTAMTADAPIRTDRASYRLADGELVIRATYANRSADTVYVQPCGTSAPLWTIEKREGEAWRRAGGPVCTMILAPPLAVAPGAERTDTLRVAGATGDLQVATIPGTYRLVYAIFAARDGEFGTRDPLPEARRVSNEFRVE